MGLYFLTSPYVEHHVRRGFQVLTKPVVGVQVHTGLCKDACLCCRFAKQRASVIFRSVLNEAQAGWAAGERGSLENQELSSGTAARAGTREIQRCKNALILPGSSPSFCHWLRYQHISLSDEFSRNSFDPAVLPVRATSLQRSLL